MGDSFGQALNSETNLVWRDARDLVIEGRGWTDTKDFYDRLPARAESLVRQNVWNLGHDSAGMCVRFVTDATTISARWTLRKESLAMALCEPEVARLLAELDPVVYVLDPLPNMTTETVAERYEQFVRILREAHPGTPIVMVENVEYTDGKFVEARRKRFAASNAKLGEIHKHLTQAGQKKLFYVSAPNLLGKDGEATET